jgi:predicted nucleic acid-binding Zn ribbon protein
VVPAGLRTKALANAVLEHLDSSVGVPIHGLASYLAKATPQNKSAADAFIADLLSCGQDSLTASQQRLGSDVACENCGTVYYLVRARQNRTKHHFCSQACHYTAGHEDRTCTVCGSVFNTTKTSPYRQCSEGCRRLAADQKRKRQYVCQMCGATFLRYPSEVRSPKYCSPRCYAAARPHPGRAHVCAHCGTTFWRYPSKTNPPKYCSMKCYHAARADTCARDSEESHPEHNQER